MTCIRGDHGAFGAPGIEPRWARGNKCGVGTAYSADSRIWYTLWNGILTEVFSPTIDRPQVRDCQFLISDGEGMFHEEKRDLRPRVERLNSRALGHRIRSEDPEGRYVLHKEVIAHPHLPCVLLQVRLEGEAESLKGLRLHLLCAPHLQIGGVGNNAYVLEVAGQQILAADKQERSLAVAASRAFEHCSCGYVGASDGWTDLKRHGHLQWEFDHARDGNVAVVGSWHGSLDQPLTIALAIGDGMHHAVTTALQALGGSFDQHRDRFLDQWAAPCRSRRSLESSAGDGGRLYDSSYSVLLGHEDKTFPGALIASLAIPWGEVRGGPEVAGYHLVWCRDMVHNALGLWAAGNREIPLRALIYLAASQEADGGYPQNFWLSGESHWSGVQLDEVAFPILLAWHLRQNDCLAHFDPTGMVRAGASYLIRHGPATEQERWEETSGYSPSTLASNIAALICAAEFLRAAGDSESAKFAEQYADWLAANIERWTVTCEGSLVDAIPRHFIRLLPVSIHNHIPDENPDHALLVLANQAPGVDPEIPARECVDAGFLELVRYGIRDPHDPLIVDSLRVVDAVLKADLPQGPCWRRYTRDGYGQRDDGSAYEGWGRGRCWPLLTGERGHYEFAAGRDARPYLQAMERFGEPFSLLPEQVWDADDLPEAHMTLGGATGAVRPLVWAHAEYIKLLRSVQDGHPFDRIPAVAQRYSSGNQHHDTPLELWKPNRRAPAVRAGKTLRFQAAEPFHLRWTCDDWETAEEQDATLTGLGIAFSDVPTAPDQQGCIRAALYWPARDRWESEEQQIRISRD